MFFEMGSAWRTSMPALYRLEGARTSLRGTHFALRVLNLVAWMRLMHMRAAEVSVELDNIRIGFFVDAQQMRQASDATDVYAGLFLQC